MTEDLKLMNTSQVQSHFGILMPADFIMNTLGIPSAHREKRAVYFDQTAIPLIADKLANYVLLKGSAEITLDPASPSKQPRVSKEPGKPKTSPTVTVNGKRRGRPPKNPAAVTPPTPPQDNNDLF